MKRIGGINVIFPETLVLLVGILTIVGILLYIIAPVQFWMAGGWFEQLLDLPSVRMEMVYNGEHTITQRTPYQDFADIPREIEVFGFTTTVEHLLMWKVHSTGLWYLIGFVGFQIFKDMRQQQWDSDT